MSIPLTNLFNDRPNSQLQTIATNNIYIQVNSDEHDRILVDPAYKLEKLKEAQEKLHAIHQSYQEVDRQMSAHEIRRKIPYAKDSLETWFKIEKAIRKLDRIFNKSEKFSARVFTDPENHERREKRMIERMKERNVNNFTYFLGGLTEEE